jgi:hypothetical protein
MSEMSVEDAEVRGEHGRGDLAAVSTVADEGADEAGLLGREGKLHGTAETGCCCGVFFRPVQRISIIIIEFR